MNGDPTTDPLTQEAWEWILLNLTNQRANAEDFDLLTPGFAERIDELIEAIQRLRHNYMAMTMILPTRQNL
jgi:hypothetical protein